MPTELIYEKYGTRVAGPDEHDESLRKFVFDGTKALAEVKGWELLYGCFERISDGFWGGDEVFAYLWPVARPKSERRLPVVTTPQAVSPGQEDY